VHLLVVALMFLNALFLWCWEYQLSHKQHWTFELYVFILSFAVVLYARDFYLHRQAAALSEAGMTFRAAVSWGSYQRAR